MVGHVVTKRDEGLMHPGRHGDGKATTSPSCACGRIGLPGVDAKLGLDLPGSSSRNRWQQRLKRVEDVDWSVWNEDGVGGD